VETEFGGATYYEGNGYYAIQRHKNPEHSYIQPAHINYRANITALHKLGVTDVILCCSVGSLQETIPIGTIAVVEDFFNLWSQISCFTDYRSHGVTALDSGLREELHSVVTTTLAQDPTFAKATVLNGGVYVQTPGPRFETKAEIRVISNYGDLVGMTGAHEITLCCERGIKCAMIGVVDNFANGIGPVQLSLDEYKKGAANNLLAVEAILQNVIARYT